MTEILKNVAMIKNTSRSAHTRILLTCHRCPLCGIKLEILFAKGNILRSRLVKAELLVSQERSV